MGMDKRPSEVFLRLWRFRTIHDDEEVPANFALCAETWAEIRRMEEAAAFRAALRLGFADAADGPSGAPAPTGLDEDVESAPAEASKNDGEEDPEPACAPVRDDRPLEDLKVVHNGPRKRKNPWEQYRQNTRRRLLNARFSSQQIAEASGGAVTVDDLRAVVDGTLIVPGNTVSAINKALDKLEGKG